LAGVGLFGGMLDIIGECGIMQSNDERKRNGGYMGNRGFLKVGENA
jgi:hypothetical protein